MITTTLWKLHDALCFSLVIWCLIFGVKPQKGKHNAPNGGLEPPTLRLRVSCSTDWASQATISNLFLLYIWGNIYVLVLIRTHHTTIILDSERVCQCNSWRTLALHRGCLEEHWCASIDFDQNIILGCGHSRFSRCFNWGKIFKQISCEGKQPIRKFLTSGLIKYWRKKCNAARLKVTLKMIISKRLVATTEEIT